MESAGIILVKKDIKDKTIKVLLLRSHDFWDFPKGGVEIGETKLDAAIREVKEESGIVEVDFVWGKIYYQTEKFGKNRKTVYYFLAKTNQDEVKLDPNPNTGLVEHEEYQWMTFEEAKKVTVKRIQKALTWAEERIVKIYESKGLE